jgi:hypothetical protein
LPSGIRIRKCRDCFELAFSRGALDGFETPILLTLHEACEQFVRRILIIRESDPEKLCELPERRM